MADNTKDNAKVSNEEISQTGTGKISQENVAQINREFQEKSTLKRAHDLGMPYINISKTPINVDFLKLVGLEDAKKARVIVFFRVGKKIRVAVDEPENSETKNAIIALQKRGYQVSLNLASSSGIDDGLKLYESTQKYIKKEIVETVEQKGIKTYEKEVKELADLPVKLEKVTGEEALNLLDIGAMKTNASDIHYEPGDKTVILRFRIDGILHKVFELKREVYNKISEQIKYQSKMRLNVTTIPQDGRYVFNYNERKIAVRVSSIPTPYGEAFVCRYLPSDKKFLTLEELGFQGLALTKLKRATEIAQGMILITGPTGSGKTTTLYSILAAMNTAEDKLVTLEDPVEYYLAGITQSQIDEKHGYNFANGLRALLRHDPDVVMVGEIRDLDTAEIVAQASLTGHVVLSTLHTNSAIESVSRLKNMGLKPFMIAPALNTVVAQRLVRKICDKCATFEPVLESEKKEFEEVVNNLKNINPSAVFSIPEKIPKVHGCDVCSNTGYKGRSVISEVVTITSEMKNLILDDSSSVKLIEAARKEGIMTMREDGFNKVAQGLTTLEEVHRVTNSSL